MSKQIRQFLIILFAISFVSAGLFFVLGGTYQSLIGTAFASLYMFMPIISVIIVQHINDEPILKGIGVSFKINRWWFVGWLLMPIFNLASLGVSTLFPGISYTTENPLLLQSIEQMSEQIPNLNATMMLVITLASGLTAGITINALFAFGEEIAWRGWLMKQFYGISFLKTALIIGVIWGFWHAPLILMGHNYPQHPIVGVFMMVAFCVALTPLIMYIRIKSKSVIAAAILHGTLNAGAGISVVYLTEHNDLIGGSCGLAGILVLLLIDCVLFFFDKKTMVERLNEI